MKAGKITIKAGKVVADFSGFQGKSCVQLEEKIRPEGLNVDEQTLKSDYNFETQSETNTDKQTW